MRGADGFPPGIGALGVDLFVLGEVQGLDEGLWRRAATAKSSPPRKAGATGHRGPLAAVALAGLKTAATTANGFAGLKTRHYNGEHKWERLLERVVDMEVSRRKDSIWDFLGSLAEARRTCERKYSTRAMIAVSIRIRWCQILERTLPFAVFGKGWALLSSPPRRPTCMPQRIL